MAEKKITKRVETNEAGEVTGRVVFNFGEGREQIFDIGSVSDAIRQRLALHGASQKIGDSYAGANKADDPIEYAEKAVQETIEQLYAGDWRVSGGVGGPKFSDLAIAISRATGNTVEDSHEFVESMSDEDKKIWRNKGKVKVALIQLRAERAQAALDRATKAAAELQVDANEDISIPPSAPATA